MCKNLLETLNSKPFPISIIEHHNDIQGQIFEKHLHNHQLQLFYFQKGRAMIYCGCNHYSVTSEDAILINSNEIHYIEKLCDSVDYFIIKINLNFFDLYTNTDCNEKYIAPIKQNLILFHSRIESVIIKQALKDMIAEYNARKYGYEFRLLSLMYNILSELFKSHIARSLSKRDAKLLGKSRAHFQHALEYIENNCESDIRLSQIAKLAEMSKGYFCTRFKRVTGKSFTDYLNWLRIKKAAILLNQEKISITDISLAVGYEDVNYFCRVFKKYMKQSPSSYRNSICRR